LAYPAAFTDYEHVLMAICDAETRPKVIDLLGDILFGIGGEIGDDADSSRLAKMKEATTADFAAASGKDGHFNTFLSRGRDAMAPDAAGDTLDAFKGTGIIVVGAAVYSPVMPPTAADGQTPPKTDAAFYEVELTRYSEQGQGLCLVAPGDKDFVFPNSCSSYAELATSTITTADIPGHGGYGDAVEGPWSYLSLEGQAFGFGGTSAASAQVAGAIALLRERDEKDDGDEQAMPLSPAMRRQQLIDEYVSRPVKGAGSSTDYDIGSGWGALSLSSLFEGA
jgi:subtilisin family serine protease